MTQLDPIVNAGLLYVNSLQVSNNAVAPNTKLDLAAGQCRDSANVIDIVLSSGVTINAAVNGINGLDTGTFAASSWYYVHVIADSSNKKPVGGLLSLSKTAPTLPFGYDSFRLLDAARADGSVHFLPFYNVGNGSSRKKYWDASIQVLNDGTASTLTAIDLSTAVPPIENTPVIINVEFTPATADDKVSFAPAGSTATVLPNISGVVAAKKQTGQLQVLSKLASSVAKILYINSAASGNTDVFVYGFELSL